MDAWMLQSTLRKWDSWPHEPIMGLVLVPSGPPVSEVQTEGSSFQGTPHSKSSGTFTESVRCSARRGGFHRRHHQSPAPWKFQARSRSPQLPSWVRTVGQKGPTAAASQPSGTRSLGETTPTASFWGDHWEVNSRTNRGSSGLLHVRPSQAVGYPRSSGSGWSTSPTSRPDAEAARRDSAVLRFVGRGAWCFATRFSPSNTT